MHEYHMVERIVLQAVEAAKENKASRITRITLVVGERAGIDPESVRLHFAQAAAGTLAAGAELVIKPGRDTAEQGPSDFYIEDIEAEG